MTSEFRTKKGVSSLPRIFSASFRGPAVPRGSVSTEKSILTLYCCSYCEECQSQVIGYVAVCAVYLCKSSSHNFGAVVDGEDNVGDTSSSKSSDLVLNHGLVAKLDQRFGESEGKRTQTGTKTADENESCMALSVCGRKHWRGAGSYSPFMMD